jgi:hypothetical protein
VASPDVLIIGGFMTAPPNYWPFRDRLLSRDVRSVQIASLWPPDWVIASTLGFGPLLQRTGRLIGRAYEGCGRQPLMVIAHSGGGIAARLAMSGVPFHGRVAGVAGVAQAVGCLVTLGTPHGLDTLGNRYRHAGHEAAAFLQREQPGAYFAPRTGYLSVGSRSQSAAFSGVVGRLADEVFSMVVGDGTAHAPGDGIVPASAVHLAGAEQITLDDVRHGMIGSPWYGDDQVIDRWWPAALRLWHEALDARRRS